MIQAEKEVYVGYIVARFLCNDPEIFTTSCTYKSKKEALIGVHDKVNVAKHNVALEIIDKGVKKVTIKWQTKSLNH